MLNKLFIDQYSHVIVPSVKQVIYRSCPPKDDIAEFVFKAVRVKMGTSVIMTQDKELFCFLKVNKISDRDVNVCRK